MATISSHNPFRANPLSPNATGVSINPPPSFHSVAGDDETTLNPLAPDLPSIAEVDDPPLPERDLPPLPASPIITLDPPPIQEEDPPAYTARPDLTHGESTLEHGPRRPFQQPQATGRPTPSPRPGLTPSFTGPGLASSYYLSPTPTGTTFPRPRRGLLNILVDALVPPFEQLSTSSGIGNLTAPDNARSQIPRQTRSFSSFTSNSAASPPPPLPPRQNSFTSHPSSPNLGRIRSPSTGSNSTTRTASTTSARSDFARDFYATGEAEGLLNLDSQSSHPRVPEQGNIGSPPPASWSTPPGAQARRRNSFDNQVMTSSCETGSNSMTRSDFARDFYAAGEGAELLNLGSGSSSGPQQLRNGWSPRPPVRRRSSFDDVTPTATSSTAPPTVDDDNRPTTRPTPGHPLLRDGKILVYPKGHTCSKCFNVGYKRADPRHPCKKCWGKYSKAYTPALLYAPDENAVTTLQRPLPRLSPPQGAPPPPPVPPPSTRPPAGLAPPQTMQTPSGRGPGAGSQQRNRLRSHRYSLSESSSPVLGGSSRPIGSPAPGNITTVTGSPPPNAIVYPAGDPRLGGSRCWRCGGSGRVSLFILDSLQCDECGGIGRLYRDYWTG